MIMHILKDGTVLQDITGHVVKMEQASGVYTLMDSINKKNQTKGKRNGSTNADRKRS